MGIFEAMETHLIKFCSCLTSHPEPQHPLTVRVHQSDLLVAELLSFPNASTFLQHS